MPYRQRKRRRGATGDFNLESLQKQSFREWFQLRRVCWDSEFRNINSREAMLSWYRSNRESFDTMRTATDGFALGHGPAERHPGWWHSTGFPQFGPRLIVDRARLDQQIERINSGVLRQRDSFSESRDLADCIAYSIPLRNFPDGFETSVDLLERNGLLDSEEIEILNQHE